MDDQIRELADIAKAITEGFEKVAQEIEAVSKVQTNALLELSEVVTSILEEYKRNSRGTQMNHSDNQEGKTTSLDLIRLITEYSNTVGRYGPDSDQVRQIRSAHADNAEFLEYADDLDHVKRHLGGSGIDRPATCKP